MRAVVFSAIALAALSACSPSMDRESLNDPCGIERVTDDGIATRALYECAGRGDARAQAYLGMVYWSESDTQYPDREGRGLARTLTNDQLRVEGRRLMAAAAAGGNPEAQNELGLAYLEGLYGLVKDVQRAHTLLTTAGEQNEPLALYNLARTYYAGLGVVADKAQARRLLWRSTSLGYQPALCTLALLHEREGSHTVARALRIAARAMDEYFFACSFDYSDVTEEFRDLQPD